ncbi:MAG: hypothetical protein WBX27_16100 [Specibacter sp.]
MAVSTPSTGSGSVQLADGGSYLGFRFAKVGLVLKAGVAFSLSVPPEMAGKMKIGWSNSGYTLADTLTVAGCAFPQAASQQAGSAWLVYPGGFWLKEPACVPLVVTSGGSSTTIHIPVGTPCP